MTNRIGLSLALTLALSAAACGSDATPTAATISGVIPGDIFAGKTANVLVLGSATDWADGVTVSFGDGITVGDIVVASPTALYVTITSDSAAVLGPRDITVTQTGQDDLAYTGAFNVVSRLKVSATQGTLAQGSIVLVKLQDLDFTTPFDNTQVGDGFFTPITFPNIALGTVGGVTANVTGVQAYSMDLTLLVDVTAAAGAKDLSLLSGPPGLGDMRDSFTLPAAVDIKAREAVALTSGVSTDGDVEAPFASVLYKVAGSGKSVFSHAVSTMDPNATPNLIALPTSGSFADLISFAPQAVGFSDGDVYLIAWDNSGTAGYTFTVAPQVAAVGTATVAEDDANNNTADAPQTITIPTSVTGATLGSDTDEDWYKVTISDADAGKAIGVGTKSDKTAPTDTVINIYAATDATTPLVSVDNSFDEAAFTGPLTAGDYLVSIVNTGGFFTPAPGPYDLGIGITAAPVVVP